MVLYLTPFLSPSLLIDVFFPLLSDSNYDDCPSISALQFKIIMMKLISDSKNLKKAEKSLSKTLLLLKLAVFIVNNCNRSILSLLLSDVLKFVTQNVNLVNFSKIVDFISGFSTLFVQFPDDCAEFCCQFLNFIEANFSSLNANFFSHLPQLLNDCAQCIDLKSNSEVVFKLFIKLLNSDAPVPVVQQVSDFIYTFKFSNIANLSLELESLAVSDRYRHAVERFNVDPSKSQLTSVDQWVNLFNSSSDSACSQELFIKFITSMHPSDITSFFEEMLNKFKKFDNEPSLDYLIGSINMLNLVSNQSTGRIVAHAIVPVLFQFSR
ncbi:hypothetical protein GEMRC1_011976 [Eukaryota sp. GEM-RC1]